MFTLDPEPVFSWPVTVRLPDGGGHTTHSLTARFRLLSDSRRERLTKEGGDAAVMGAALIALDGVTGADGKPFPNTPAALEAALDHLPLRQGLVEAYLAAAFGPAPGAAARGN